MEEQVNQSEEYLQDFLHQIVTWLPKLIGALLILLIGYIVAKAIAKVMRKALHGMDLDKRLHAGKGGNVLQRAIPSPSGLISAITFWVIYLGAISLGIGALGIPLLTDLIRGFYSYLPNIIAALIIFLVASALSAGVAGLVSNTMGDTPTGKVVAGAAPLLIMGLAIFMILNQLKIAPEIVTITYAALLGSVALGSAIAFGLGGREAAANILNGAYDKAQSQKGQIVSDTHTGAARASQRANELKRRANEM